MSLWLLVGGLCRLLGQGGGNWKVGRSWGTGQVVGIGLFVGLGAAEVVGMVWWSVEWLFGGERKLEF